MLQIIRAVLVYSILIFTFILSYFYFRFINIFYSNLNFKKQFKIKRNFYTNLFVFLFNLIFWIKIEIDMDENDEIDLKENNYIFVSNHVSYLDNFILLFLSKKFKNNHYGKFVGMEKILSWPIIGYVFKELGLIPIKMLEDINNSNNYCEESKKKLKKDCNRLLINKYSLFLFPEGRLNDNPKKLNKIFSGAYYFSKNTNTKIKLIGLKNIEKIWPKYKHPIGSGTIKIKLFKKDYKFNNLENYKKEIRNNLENWLNS